MRGKDEQQLDVFSYVRPEQRVPHDHHLRALRVMIDEALRELQPRLNKLYAKTGRLSIAPATLLRALLRNEAIRGGVAFAIFQQCLDGSSPAGRPD
jgi:transposase